MSYGTASEGGGAAVDSLAPHAHPLEVRRQAVQLYLEDGFSAELIAREMGVGQATLSKWVRLYRDHGEAGLKSKKAGPSRQRPKVAAAGKRTGRRKEGGWTGV